MKSRTRIEKKAKRKTSLVLVETIRQSKKLDDWNEISDLIASPKRKYIIFNLSEINDFAKDGENIVIPGKVLSQGEINKKIRVVALKFSERAMEKLLRSKISFSYIGDEIKKNPNAKDLKILR